MSEPLDAAEILSTHEGLHRCVGGDYVSSRNAKHMDPPCEVLFLAESWRELTNEVDRLQTRVKQLEKERDQYEESMLEAREQADRYLKSEIIRRERGDRLA